MKQLPEGFLWGGATADFQYEGGFNEGGRGLLSHDFETDGSMENPRHHTFQMPDGTILKPRSSFFYADPVPNEAKPVFLDDEYYPSHQAVDFYHHYKEDIALMAEMGFNVFRFSICWSRIYPLGDEETPNEEGLKFYDEVISELEKHHMEPLITICHDEMPMHLALKYGGWSNRFVIDCAKQALENDIPVVLGNDVGCPWVSQYDFWRELYYFHKYIGVSNRFALYTATSLASKYAGLENITGSIDVGKDADMIVVSENPLDDLKALRYVEKVFTRGKLIDYPKVKINKTVETELDKYL